MSVKPPSLAEFDAHQRRDSVVVAAALAGMTALTAMNSLGHRTMLHDMQRQSTEPGMYVQPGESTSHLIFAQFGINTQDLPDAERFHQRFRHLGTTASVLHPSVGVPIDAIKQKMVETREAHPDAAVIMYGHSFGGFLNGLALTDPEFRTAMGPIELMIYDSAFLHRDALSLLGRSLLKGADRTRLNWLVANAPSVYSRPYLMADQYHFLQKQQIAPGSLESVVDRVVMVQARKDPLLQNNIARQTIRLAHGSQVVERYTDGGRPKWCHEGALYHPALVQAIMAQTVRQGDTPVMENFMPAIVGAAA